MDQPGLSSQSDKKIVFRRLQRYSFIAYILFALVAVILIPRADKILSKITFLNISNITVQTLDGDIPKYLTRTELKEVFNKYEGQNYFTFESEKLRQELSSTYSFVKDSYISKQFPKTVLVEIVEREPFIATQVDKDLCVLLDAQAYTLEISQYSEDKNCALMKTKYRVPILLLPDSKVTFKENQQSSFYVVEDIWKIAKVLSKYGYQTEGLTLDDQVLTTTVNGKRKITISLNQSVDTQLERFISIVGQIEEDNLDFKSIDLRYKRPVLQRK